MSLTNGNISAAILFVDDDPAVGLPFTRLLEAVGYRVTYCENRPGPWS
ncbi:MAG: hypothetical protein ABIF71_01425 [Planctomycetota bacterium]